MWAATGERREKVEDDGRSIPSYTAQSDFAERFDRGKLSSRRPDVRTRTAGIRAIAASRTPLWLLSGWGCRGRRLSDIFSLFVIGTRLPHS